MSRIASLAARLRAVFRGADAEVRMEEEFRFHIEMETRKLAAEGIPAEEARRRAVASFGGLDAQRESMRDGRGARLMHDLAADVKYGARMLRRSPAFALVAVLSIAGGLAAGTAIFAFMNAFVYRPLGVGDGQSLYKVFTSSSRGNPYGSSSYPDFEAFRAGSAVLASACATTRVLANVLVKGAAEPEHGAIVSPGCFDALKLTPQLGRFFSENNAAASTGSAPIVISHSLWVRRFAGDPSVVGRPILLNGLSATVTAVAPKGFAGTSFDSGADFWAPVDVAAAVLPADAVRRRDYRGFTIFARLRDGVDRAQAEAALAVVAAQLRNLDEGAWTDTAGATRKVTVMRETEARFADSQGGTFELVGGGMASAAGVVLIACLNLATMLLARGAARTREMSIRLAIGASRGRVLRQLATESLMIATIGAAAAIAVVSLGIRLFEANRPAVVPAFDLAVDWRVQAFAIALAMMAALLFGMAPALHTLRLALAEGLTARLAAGGRRIRVPAREGLIVLQVAVSIALLLVSTLFVRARDEGAALSPGFNAANVAVVTAHLDAVPPAERAAATERVLQAARTVQDVDYVSLARVIPMTGSSIGIAVTGDDGAERSVLGNVVSSGYFATMDIPMRSGRDFDQRDREGGAPVAIVGETFARSAWGEGTTNAAGRSVVVDGRRMEVVGVVADVRYRRLSEPFQPVIYIPIAQVPERWRFILHARVRGGAETLAALDATLRAVDDRVAIERAMPLRARIEEAMGPERAAQWIGGIVGVVQLGLAVMALWGLVAYAVERRTSELGVRLALGAPPSSLVRLTMKPAGVSILVGVGLGSVLGILVAKVVQSQSAGLAPLDLVAVVPVAAAFTIAAMLAAWWPARRAGMADPAASLRRE